MSLAVPARRERPAFGARLIRVRSWLTLAIVGLYLVLDWGFMLVRVPPGSDFGVPCGELLILLYLITLPFDIWLLGAFAAVAPLAPLLVWWSVGGMRMIIGVASYGGWALRDATSLIESSFLWIGFLTVAYASDSEAIWRWFDKVLTAGLLVALTYPFRTFIQAISPKMPAVAGTPAPLFFSYTLSGLMTLTAVLRAVICEQRLFGYPVAAIGGLLVIYVAALLQERTVYLQTFLVLGLIVATQPRQAWRRISPMAIGLLAGVAILAAVLASGIPIPGRFGENITMQFYIDHFAAIWGAGADDATSAAHGSAVGVGQRMVWWAAIWKELLSNTYNLVFGLGYGISLVALAHDPTIAVTVREPHNSLVSSLGRTGVIGLLSYVSLHVCLIWTVAGAYRQRTWAEDRTAKRWLVIVLGFLLMCWIDAMGEDAFEKPFVAIPYYFLCGAALNFYYRRRQATKASWGGRKIQRSRKRLSGAVAARVQF